MKFPHPRRAWYISVHVAAACISVAASIVLNASEASSEMEQRWQRIKDLQHQLSQEAPKGVNEVEFFTPVKTELHLRAREFAAVFPDDARRWEARLIEVKTTQFPIPADERKTLFARNEETVASIAAASDATAEIKQNAERTILFQHLDHLDLIHSPQEAATLEKRLLDYVHKFPDDPKSASLQVRQLDFLAKIDPLSIRPLLEELATSSNPKVATAARGRIEQSALSSRPLDWKFTALDGRAVDLVQMRGRVILIDYWASWCPDCLRALPQVLATYRKYHERGFEVIGISLDNDKDALLSFLKKREMPWPEYFDGKGWQSDLVTKYGVGGIPNMWIVGQDGRVVATGVQTNEIDEKVASLLVK